MDKNNDNQKSSSDQQHWADQQDIESRPIGFSSLSRRKFIYTVGAAVAGAVAAKIAVPKWVSTAMASDLEDIARAKAVALQSPLYQQVVANLEQRGFAFNLEAGVYERCPNDNDTIGIIVNGMGVPAQVAGAHIIVTVRLAPGSNSAGMVNTVEGVVGTASGDNLKVDVQVVHDHQRRISYTKLFTPDMATVFNGPPLAPFDQMPEKEFPARHTSPCGGTWEEPAPGSQWEINGCNQTRFCKCPDPVYPECEPGEWGDLCVQYRQVRQYMTCREDHACRVWCGNRFNKYRAYPGTMETCREKGCYCGG